MLRRARCVTSGVEMFLRCFFFSLQAQRSPNSGGLQPKTEGPPQTRARTGAPPTDAGSELSGKRQRSNGNDQPQPKRLPLPHTDGHTLHDCRWRNPTQGGPGRITVHMTGSFAEPDCTALHCAALPLAQRPKKGSKPKRTQRPKRARSRKGWPNSEEGRQRSQRLQTDQSTLFESTWSA